MSGPTKILVVDDDGDVCDVIVEILTDHSFATTAANGGVAMREVLAAGGPPINAVVLDSLMPANRVPPWPFSRRYFSSRS